jgi:hypothetical protein
LYKIFLHPLALDEIIESKNFYDSKVEGLGTQLLEEMDRAFKLIEEDPASWLSYDNNLYRFILKRFPFSVIYRIRKDKIEIIALMHHHRKPLYWKKRLS